MSEPSADVQREVDGCVRAHRCLVDDLAGLTDAQARRASLLPNWSVGHVLTHLARNADGLAGMIDGAGRGEVVPQYPSPQARRDGIDDGAGRTAAELVADVRDSAARLEARWAAGTAAAWSAQSMTAAGPTPIVEVPYRRWREVEVHHADLGLGFEFANWSADYVRLELVRMQIQWASRRPMGLTTMPPEALAVEPHRRLAWLMNRTTIDGLEPAAIF